MMISSDVIDILIDGQKEMREQLSQLRTEIGKLREEMAFQKGSEKGRATIFGAISGVVTGILIHWLGPGFLEIFQHKK
jgi:hypothetical protein